MNGADLRAPWSDCLRENEDICIICGVCDCKVVQIHGTNLDKWKSFQSKRRHLSCTTQSNNLGVTCLRRHPFSHSCPVVTGRTRRCHRRAPHQCYCCAVLCAHGIDTNLPHCSASSIFSIIFCSSPSIVHVEYLLIDDATCRHPHPSFMSN